LPHMSGPSNLFVNAYMYAVNKAAYKVMGKGGITISRLATDDLIEFLREKGVLSDRPSVEEIKRLFIEDLAIADQLEIEEKECELSITLRGLKSRTFSRRFRKKGSSRSRARSQALF
jgi:hypothetical protein